MLGLKRETRPLDRLVPSPWEPGHLFRWKRRRLGSHGGVFQLKVITVTMCNAAVPAGGGAAAAAAVAAAAAAAAAAAEPAGAAAPGERAVQQARAAGGAQAATDKILLDIHVRMCLICKPLKN